MCGTSDFHPLFSHTPPPPSLAHPVPLCLVSWGGGGGSLSFSRVLHPSSNRPDSLLTIAKISRLSRLYLNVGCFHITLGFMILGVWHERNPILVSKSVWGTLSNERFSSCSVTHSFRVPVRFFFFFLIPGAHFFMKF